jgi:hypothetical protein
MATQKPKRCPKCRATRVLLIEYGLPGPEMEEAYARGEIELGGCCVGEDDPKWACPACEHRWGRRYRRRAVAGRG